MRFYSCRSGHFYRQNKLLSFYIIQDSEAKIQCILKNFLICIEFTKRCSEINCFVEWKRDFFFFQGMDLHFRGKTGTI